MVNNDFIVAGCGEDLDWLLQKLTRESRVGTDTLQKLGNFHTTPGRHWVAQVMLLSVCTRAATQHLLNLLCDVVRTWTLD